MDDDGHFDDSNPVSFSEFNQWFMASGADKPCPDCGASDWRVPSRRGANRPVMLAALQTPDGGEFFPVYLAYCARCGHVKQYAAQVVMEAIRGRT